jgi:DNA-directed RNA polymerase specialized sigma24 family protein
MAREAGQIVSSAPKLDDLWPKFRAVATDGESAWQALAAALHPVVLRFAAHQPIGRLRADKDAPHEIATRVLERLHAREFAAITKLCAADPAPPLEAWLRVLVKNAAIDVVREAPEFERKTEARDARWISLDTLVSTPGAAPDSLVEKRNAVIAFVNASVAQVTTVAKDKAPDDVIALLSAEWGIARIHIRRLLQRGPRYLAVIEAVLSGHSYPEVGERLGITRREVELTVQYVEELLAARRFAVG